MAVLVLFGLSLVLGWWMTARALGNAEKIMAYHNSAKELTLTVTQSTERAGDKVLLAGAPKEGPLIRVESAVYFPALPGDTVQLTGSFAKLEPDLESTFNYPLYLAKNGIGAVFRAREAQIQKSGPASPARLLATFRRASLDRITQLWPGDVGALIAGILVGARGSFSEELNTTMRNTGLMHIVAVSGSNMTILINAILALTTALKMRWRVGLCILALTLFTLLVGPSGAVVRACLMGIIALLAKLYQRPSTAFLCLVYAATLMLLFSPLDLLYDIGFQLSFLAVLGLLWGGPLVEPLCRRLPAIIRDELATTLAAIAWTLPISIVYFGNVSLVAPLANLLIPPSIPLLMLGGFITFIASWLPLAPITWALGTLVQLHTSFLLWGCSLLAAIPFAAIPYSVGPAWALPFALGCYGFLAWHAYKHSN